MRFSLYKARELSVIPIGNAVTPLSSSWKPTNLYIKTTLTDKLHLIHSIFISAQSESSEPTFSHVRLPALPWRSS